MNAIAGRTRTRRAVRLGVLVAAAVAIAACDSNNARLVVGGSALQPSSVVAFATTSTVAQIQPTFLSRQSLTTFGCPLLPPFTTSFQIVIVQPRVDLFLNQVTLRFIDGTSLGGTPIPFPQPNLTRLFGHTFIRAFTTRAFPFSQGFGCFPSSPRRMSAEIQLVDGNGASQETTVSADIQ
jgi:hypothetical protein